jgi:hypothetical protein
MMGAAAVQPLLAARRCVRLTRRATLPLKFAGEAMMTIPKKSPTGAGSDTKNGSIGV